MPIVTELPVDEALAAEVEEATRAPKEIMPELEEDLVYEIFASRCPPSLPF